MKQHNTIMPSIQRRMFRGRGGPTDGRLPRPKKKFLHRKSDSTSAGNKYCDSEIPHESDDEIKEQIESQEGESSSLGETEGQVEGGTNDNDASEKVSVEEDNPVNKELQHLRERIQNVQRSMTLSSRTIDLNVYETNVLAATRNCFIEYASIQKRYDFRVLVDDSSAPPSDPSSTLSADIKLEYGQKLYQLLQQALQTGPLFGAKPGYFKRCGSEAARLVYGFLNDDSIHWDQMGFTPKQLEAISVWKTDSLKAANRDKPPSKAVLKRQHNAKKSKG